jgi:hypothetical protein
MLSERCEGLQAATPLYELPRPIDCSYLGNGLSPLFVLWYRIYTKKHRIYTKNKIAFLTLPLLMNRNVFRPFESVYYTPANSGFTED